MNMVKDVDFEFTKLFLRSSNQIILPSNTCTHTHKYAHTHTHMFACQDRIIMINFKEGIIIHHDIFSFV